MQWLKKQKKPTKQIKSSNLTEEKPGKYYPNHMITVNCVSDIMLVA